LSLFWLSSKFALNFIPMNLYDTHKELLDTATKAVFDRSFYAAYPEHPKAYNEDGAAKGIEWLNGQLGNTFSELLQTQEDGFKGDEVSPYTQEQLNISYPYFRPDKLVVKAEFAGREWKNTTPETRASILIASLERIKHRFFDIAYATMHTSGQSFMMSFQASGPHANDRALEAIVLGYVELKRFPDTADWEKPMGKFSIRVKKKWRAIGRGVSLVIGCSTFPVWNSVPGLYASLMTGNPVIVKPHPGAILPIAIVVAEIQKALLAERFNPDLVQLAVDTASDPIAKKLVEHPDVKIIDYTGNTHFGDYVEGLKGKIAFTEKAGVNSVILDSVKDLDAVLQNLAFAACLYSGQMCTAPQNFFIPETGVKTADDIVPFNEVARRFAEAVKAIVTNPKMAAGTLGAIQSMQTSQRVVDAKALDGKVLLESIEVSNEEFPNARTASPLILEVDVKDKDIYSNELFGPVVLLIKTDNTKHSVSLAKELAKKKGAISCGAYATDPEMIEYIESEMEEAFTPVAFNLTGPIWMNQNAAFSDFHVTGGNPAGNATFTDSAYITRRFVWVGHKEAM
jgi:phenylacetic acid degradation protein paaN